MVHIFRLSKNDRITDSTTSGGNQIKWVTRQSVKRLIGIDITEDLQKVINLDAITLNEDRHFNNIALLYKEDLGYTGLSPIFDNGLSLLSNTELYPLSNRVGSLMSDIRAKPFLSSFKQQVMLFQTEQLFAVDMEGFEKACERFTTDCGRDKELNRAVSVLLRSLERTEGLTWRALSC